MNAEVRIDEATGLNKGFGWVEMSTRAESIAVMKHLDDLEFHAHRLTATVLNPPELALGEPLTRPFVLRYGLPVRAVSRCQDPTANLNFSPIGQFPETFAEKVPDAESTDREEPIGPMDTRCRSDGGAIPMGNPDGHALRPQGSAQ